MWQQLRNFSRVAERISVAEACNLPNALIVPFRIELFRPVV
jgi:hypothetical protein